MELLTSPQTSWCGLAQAAGVGGCLVLFCRRLHNPFLMQGGDNVLVGGKTLCFKCYGPLGNFLSSL